MAATRRGPRPWGNKFGNGPIEMGRFRRGDSLHEEAVRKEALAELDRRIEHLAKHYGAGTDRELLVAILGEVDPAFTIKGKAVTGARWQGQEAEPFVKLVEAIRYAGCYPKNPLPWKYVLRHLQAMGYGGVHADEANLRANYNTAVTYLKGPKAHRFSVGSSWRVWRDAPKRKKFG